MKTITISKRTYMQAAIGNAQRQRQALYTILLKVLPVVLLALVSANGLIAQNMDMQATFSSFRGNCPEVGDEEYTWNGALGYLNTDGIGYNCQTVDADNSPYVKNYDREGLVRSNTDFTYVNWWVEMWEDDYGSRCFPTPRLEDCKVSISGQYVEFPNLNEFSETIDTHVAGNSAMSLTTTIKYRYTRFPLSQVLQPQGSNGDLANPIGSGSRPFWGSQGSWANGVSGSYTAASGTIEHNGLSRLKITPINKSSVSFLWKADTQLNFDKVTVYVNNNAMRTLSGQTGWEAVTIDMPAGTSVNTVTWQYTKDGSVSTGEDRVWIKNLVLNDGIPDIDVLGNGISIASGDITPSLEDDTDFGEVPLGSFADKTYTVRNAGTNDLRVNLEAISSTNPEFELIDFSVPGLYSMPPGTTETFTMRFTPTTTGIKTTDIEIPNITPNPDESLWYEIRLQGGDEMCPAVINTCPLAITVATDPGSCSASGVTLGNPATDACPGETITNDAPATFPIGNTTVTWTVTSVNGGTATCTAVITVEDNEDPVIACAPNGTRTTDPTLCEYTVIGTEFDATFTDNCTAGVITNDLNGLATIAGEILVKGDTTVIWTVDDGNGQTAICSTVITVEDNEGPMIVCLGNITQDNDAGICGAVITYTTPVGTDNCTGATTAQTAGFVSGSVFPVGTTTNTFVVTDASGNTATCSFDVTVNDTEAPEIICSGPIIQDNDAGVCEATITVPAPIFTDNCFDTGGCVQTDDLDSYALGSISGQDPNWVGWTGMATENGEVSTEQAQSGTQSLKITAGPVDQIYNFGNQTSGVWEVTYSLFVPAGNTAYTNIQKFVRPAGGPEWGHQIQWNSDGSAEYNVNSTFNTFTYPQGQWFEVKHLIDLDNDTTEFFVDGTSVISHPYRYRTNSNTGAVSLGGINFFPTTNVFGTNGTEPNPAAIPLFYVDDLSLCVKAINDYNNTVDASDVYPLGTTNVVWTITDGSGNTDTCMQVVTVEDNEDPVITCAPNTTLSTDPGLCEYTVVGTEFDATFTDNCTTGAITNDLNGLATIAGEVLAKGDTTVVWTVDDGNGQTATCTTVITIEDNEDPVVTCAPNGTRDTDPGVCQYMVVGTEFDATFTDNCTDGSITNDLNGTATIDGEVLLTGDTTVIWTVDDGNGQTVTCTTVITVEDNEAPIIACPADVMANTSPGDCFAEVVFPDAIAIDNCDVTVMQTEGLPSGSMFPVGLSTVTYTASDSSGNATICSFTITVTDNEPAMAVCQDITIQLDANGDAMIVAADVDGGSTDNCGVASIAIDMDTFDCSNLGPNNVTLEVTDVNGNISTCIAVVTVEDVTMPDVVCMDITVELDATGTITILGSDVDGGSTDACGIVSYDLDMDTFDCSNVGENTVTLTVTDTNGNASSCTSIVTVEDNIAPELDCMDITVELDQNGMVEITADDVIESNSDNCGISTSAVDITMFDCSDIGTPIEVQVFTEDSNGNLSSCFATVTVIDALAPVITCPADQTVDPGEGNLFYEVPDYFVTGEATLVDNCTDPVTITSQDPAPGALISDGVYTVTLSAEDAYGNLGECTFELTVESLLGIGDNNIDVDSVVMYPNPASDFVTISNPQGVQLETVAIYDITGRLVISKNLRDMTGEETINVSSLTSATYMVLISGPEGQITKQLIKE